MAMFIIGLLVARRWDTLVTCTVFVHKTIMSRAYMHISFLLPPATCLGLISIILIPTYRSALSQPGSQRDANR